MAGLLVWTASVTESEWHAVMRWEWYGARPIAVCGHVVPGKVHGRRDVEPPQNSERSTCAACCAALEVAFGHLPGSRISPAPEPDATEVLQHPVEDTARDFDLASALELFPSWPSADPDTNSPRRRGRTTTCVAVSRLKLCDNVKTTRFALWHRPLTGAAPISGRRCWPRYSTADRFPATRRPGRRLGSRSACP